jgi:hypothetical protein
MKNKQKILNIIEKSQLSAEDKKEWETIANSWPEELLESTIVILETFPSELPWFTDIFKRKKEAFAVLKNDREKGEKMLKEIFEEERKKIEEMGNKQA